MDEEFYLSNKGNVTNKDMKKTEIIALYFSGKWCKPCEMFTPILTKFYEQVNKEKKQLEIIYVSTDENTEEFDEYFAKMPWLAIPWSLKLLDVGHKYHVQGVPSLFIVEKKLGEVVSYKGR